MEGVQRVPPDRQRPGAACSDASSKRPDEGEAPGGTGGRSEPSSLRCEPDPKALGQGGSGGGWAVGTGGEYSQGFPIIFILLITVKTETRNKRLYTVCHLASHRHSHTSVPSRPAYTLTQLMGNILQHRSRHE